MAYYDDVIERNKRYLTNAQVNALVAASQEYNIQNAGNRAGALASAREQYDTGYRGLQNMGLAGSVSGPATSGEVPRLKAQVSAPFEDYNRRLRDVENRRLSAIGGQFAVQTQEEEARIAAEREEAARRAAEAQRQEALKQAQLAAASVVSNVQTAKQQAASASAATKAQIDGLKLTASLKQSITDAANKYQQDGAKRTAQAQQQMAQDQVALKAAAEVLGVKTVTKNAAAANAAQERGAALTAKLGGNTDTSTMNVYRNMTNQEKADQTKLERDVETAKQNQPTSFFKKTSSEVDAAKKALEQFNNDINAGFDKGEAEKQLADAQKKVDALASVRDTSARPGAEEAYQQAVAQRDAAQLKVEDPLTYSFLVVANSNADAETKRLVGEKFMNEKLADDTEDAALKYKSAKETVSRMEAQLGKGEDGPSLRDVNDAIEVYYSAVKAYEDTAGNGAPSAASREPIDKANKMLNDLGFKSIHAAERYRDSITNTEEPEGLQQAREALAAADLRYNDPDTYRAIRLLQYKDQLKLTNPDVVKWAEEKAADYQLQAMGIKTPGMATHDYRAEEADAKGLRKAYNNWKMSQGDAAEWYYEKELKDKYGVTPSEAEKRLNQFDTEKDARLEYSYYKDGMVALLDHSGETPSRPVNTDEADPIYRKVNGLSNITMAASEYEGAESYSVANWMTQEQKDAYNAIYEKDGIEAADQYFKDITPFLNMQRAMEDEAYYKQYADEHPFLADLRSVGASVLYNVPAAIDRLAHGVVGAYYDPNSDMSYRSGRADIIRSERSQNILNNMSRPEWVNNVLNFAYQTGMSMADSGVAMTFAYAGAPWMVDALFFSSAGNAAYKEARERGATQTQAMEIGILSGFAEAFFEHASIEHFMKLDYTGKGALVKNLLSQGFVEGSEEVATEIANALTDAWIMKDNSKYSAAVKEYMSQGMPEEQAQNKAFMDQLGDIGMAGLGGLVSGGLFALGGAVINSAQYSKEGKRLNADTKAKDRIIQMAEIMGGDAQKALDAYNADQTNRNLGELSATVQNNMLDMFGKEVPDVSKASAMHQAEGTGNQMDLDAAVRDQIVDKATAYAALLSGDKMVAATAQTVLDVLGAEQLKSMGYDASSAMKLMSSYNKRLDQYGIQSRADALTNHTFEPVRGIYRSQALQTPSSLGATRVGSALAQTQERATAANATRAENMAVDRVWENPTQGLTQTFGGRSITPMPGNLTAVAFADQQRNNFKANATATTGSVTYAVAGMQAREGMSNEQTLSEIKKGLTKEARQKAEVYEKLSKALGMKMIIHDVMAGTNGFIDENGNMHVVLSGKQSVLRVAAHELTHYMQKHAGEHYSALRKHLINEVGQDKFDRMVTQKAREYGLDLSTERGRSIADDEVCAELCERMLSDEESLEKFAEKDTAAAKALKDHLVKILNAIKSAFKRIENRDFGSSWSDLIKNQDTIESWITGLQEAIRNADARAATNEGQIGSVAGVTTVDQNDLIEDIKDAKTDAEVDEAFAEHSVDVIEYDMAGYREDLVKAGILSDQELKDLFKTMKSAVKYVKDHRAILDFGEELDTPEKIEAAKKNRAYNPYKQNADPHYKLALDFSTLCKKRILMQMIAERLQSKLGRAVSAAETIAIRREIQKLQKQGVDVEVACALCYVEAARLKSPKVINEFLGVDLDSKAAVEANVEAEMKNFYAQNVAEIRKDINNWKNDWKIALFGTKSGQQWWEVNGKTDKNGNLLPVTRATKKDIEQYGKSIGKDNLKAQFEADTKNKRASSNTNDTQNEEIAYAKRMVTEHPEVFLSAKSLAKMKLEHPDVFYAFTNKVRSATRSKALETDTFYARGDISMVSDSVFKYANAESGFRHQSWSDFMPIHLLDTMASIIEMSTHDAKMHAYTKVPAMVELLGNTGMMLNMSLIPSGQTGIVDGKLAFDSVEGMDFEEMLELRDRFPNTAGNIAIGISDEQIRLLLASDDIDYVIPYHVSGLNKELRKHMGIHTWLDFTSSQNESEVDGKAPSGRTWKEEHKAKKMKPPALAAWFDEKAAKAAGSNGIEFMQQAAQKYLDICARDGWVPKFSQYLTQDADGKYHTKEGYENYWKMLTDRKMVNQKTGEVIIQQAVKPNFDNDTVMGILEGEVNDPAAIKNAAVATEVVNNLSQTWRADRDNANLQDKKELNRMREAAAVMAADQSAERVKQDIERRKQTMDTHYDLEAAESNIHYSLADDELSRILDSGEMVKVYRAMQVIDGKLYPPMAAKVAEEAGGKRKLVQPTEIGKWYVSEERPDLIDPKTGKYKLDKANGSTIDAAYNPYFHTSMSPLNDQFSSAYSRPNLVVVEGYVPKSELSSGYHAQYAKNSVGATSWHQGPVSSKLSTPRTVILSRYFKANRVLSDAEVARKIADFMKNENVSIPQNTVAPGLYAELQKLGVPTTAMYSIDPEDMDLPYLAINDSKQDFTGQIMRGEKTIETRKYPIPDALVGKWVPIVRTGKGAKNNQVVGYVKFSGDKKYSSASEFRADEGKHLVKAGSDYDINGTKYGWVIEDVKPLDNPITIGTQGFAQGEYRYRDLAGIIDDPNTMYSIDDDDLRYFNLNREAFTHIDRSALENRLESLRGVTTGKGLWALKDISRFLDSVAGGSKDLRDDLTKIFEDPHRQALKNYATGVSEMQKKVLEIGAKAGVCDDKGHHFDKKKSAAIQNIGEGFCNKATDVTVRVVDADAVRVTATDKETGKSLGTKDYTFRELRGAYGHEVADQLWSDAFDAAQKEGRHVDVEREVNTQPYTLADLKEAYPQDWQKLKTAADEFRTMYDNYIRDINNMLETIYPYASKYATVDQITEAIEKKQQRLADRKAAYTTQIENLKKSLEEKEKEIASKRKTDTATYRKLVEQRNVLKTRIADTQAEIAEYEANIKDQLTVMGEEKAMMMNAEREGDSLGRMHRLEYRSDYFHHFTEMTSWIQNLKSIFTGNTDISPAVVGKSDTTKPKSRWAGFFQQRKGGDYTADALNGMLRYGQLAEYKMAFDPFAAYLRDVEKQVASLDKNETNRDNLIRYIQQWTNTILGKSHTIDRALVDSGVGMRSKLFKAMSWINSRVIQNTLLWNMRSALIQISNVTNAKGIVTNNLDWANGLRKWALARRGNSEMQAIMNQSTFLASRYMDNLQLTDSVFKSAKEFAGWLLGALDEVSAKATWWAAYTQYQRNPNAKVIQNAYRTYDNAIEYADDVTRRTHAGRGVGELAPAMTSRVINLIAPFQVEVNNTYQLLKDNVKQKNFLGLLSTGLSIFALNTIFEAIVGSTPLGFDLIRAIVDIAFGIAGDDPEDDDDDYDVKRAAQRIAGEFVGGLPYANQIVGLIGKDNAEKIIGSDTDVTRYGNTQIGLNAMMNTIAGISDIGSAVTEGKNLFTETNFISDIDDLLNIIMPMGAKQMTRTAEGLLTMAKGYGGKVDKEGNEKVQFVADNDLVNWLHAGLFGKWSLTQASEYFDEERLLPKLFGAYEGPRSATGKLVDAEEYKAALETGIDGKQFFSLKYDMKDYTTQGGKRAEMMQQSFTPEQKAKLDALMLGSKDAEMKAEGAVVYQKSGDEWKVKADYTNQDMFDLSQAGDKTYTGTLEAMEKTGLPQDQAVLVSSMWDQAKKADDSKAEFRNMLRDNKNLTVAQKEALDLQYCGNKYAADYSDPELYELSITNRTTYEKAKQAKANGIPVKNYVSLLDKKNDYSGEDKADYMRREIMSSSLTAQQKELLDDLLVSDQGRNPDYSSQAWFDISMLGGGQYQEAKEGEKVGLKPETYLTIYNKWKTLDAKNENGKTVNGLKKKRAKEYLDSLTISAPVYDYIWTVIFGYKK